MTGLHVISPANRQPQQGIKGFCGAIKYGYKYETLFKARFERSVRDAIAFKTFLRSLPFESPQAEENRPIQEEADRLKDKVNKGVHVLVSMKDYKDVQLAIEKSIDDELVKNILLTGLDNAVYQNDS